MEKKTVQSVSPAIREAMNKANRARDPAMQMLLLKDIVKQEPGFMTARTKLRELEKRQAMASGFFPKMMAQILSSFALPKIKSQTAKDPVKAMGLCEDQLLKSLDNPPILAALADAAENAGAMFIAVEARTLIRDFHPTNESNLTELARCMQGNNQAREALKIIQEIASRHPGSMEWQSEVRAAAALASIEKGKWEEEGTSQEKAVDVKGNVAQQIIDGTIHDAGQAKVLAEHLLEELKEKDSIDTRRKLVEAYMVMEDYDSAIAELEKVVAALGTMDPFIDKNIEEAVVARFNKAIKELSSNPAAYSEPEKQIADFTAQRDAYILERAEDRVKKFPNDAQLAYELAEVLFKRDRIDDAIGCFQNARRNPQRRVSCMVYLGRCFSHNGRYDMAIEQFETALKEMERGDKSRLETIYYLANTLELAGEEDKAIERFKEIYQAQANFMDVAKRIENYYERHKQQ